jgi:seryl-tRNA synthetase
MLDINFIRKNKESVRKALRKRKIDVDIENLLKIDEKWRNLTHDIEELRKEKNKISATKKEKNIKKAKSIKIVLSEKEPALKKVKFELDKLLFSLPNIPDTEVPDGEGEEDNQVIRKWGKPRKFSFPFKDHTILAKALDIIDIKRGVKVSGNGFYYLKNEGAFLEMALMHFALDKAREKGFHYLTVPSLVNEKAMVGTGFFPADENEIYKINKDELYLAGTAEVGLASYRANEIIDEDKLPLHYVSFSTCFRREAGAYGKTAKGVFRVHQFNKVELFVICKPDQAEEEHQKLVRLSEEILQRLKLPYEVVINCLGDLGFPNKKRYDINTWMPYWNGYRETHSASNDGDFQARRLKIRYRTKKGELKYCNTLNNTALASPRIMVAILENYQRQDGSIKIPDILHPYLGFKEICR